MRRFDINAPVRNGALMTNRRTDSIPTTDAAAA
jgi:hypothetical protein